jgi:plasmid replication initiation protein
LSPHASTEELEHRYRKAKDPVERSHHQIVWLLSEGRTTEEVCQVTGYSQAGCATLRQATTSSPRTAPSVQVRFLV